jgi:hypothetical protein
MTNQPSDLNTTKFDKYYQYIELISVLLIVVITGYCVVMLVLQEGKRKESNQFKPETVDLTIPNAKIAQLELKIQENEVIINQLLKSLAKKKANEKRDVIDYVGVEYLDSTGIDNKARAIILLADSLRRTGHSWYEPIP